MAPDFRKIKVLCYDGQSLADGVIERVRGGGCDFICRPNHAMPLFARKCRVRLDLFKESTGEGQTVEARITDYSRRDGLWVYRIRWKEAPAILNEGLQLVKPQAA